MKRFATILTALAIVFAIFATPAYAMPNKFKNCPQTKQDGITYILYGKLAIVCKTPRNAHTITIPNKISIKGKKYLVRAIWDRTFELNKSLQTVNLKATSLECIEDPAIFTNHKIKVNCYNRFTYNWLKRGGVNVVKKF